MKSLLFHFFILLLSISLHGQVSEAEMLIDKSIKYHDPQNRMMNGKTEFLLSESRPGGTDRITGIKSHPNKQVFELNREVDGTKTFLKLSKGKSTIKISHNDSVVAAEEKNKMTPERIKSMKNYYEYLWYMPMKLKDAGTKVNPQVTKRDFFGKEALEIKVNYSEEVGKDIWFFYFHPKTSALIGYRFYHDETANDGEYILFEGEIENNGVKIPQKRSWYTHKDDKLLGTDTMVKLKVK